MSSEMATRELTGRQLTAAWLRSVAEEAELAKESMGRVVCAATKLAEILEVPGEVLTTIVKKKTEEDSKASGSSSTEWKPARKPSGSSDGEGEQDSVVKKRKTEEDSKANGSSSDLWKPARKPSDSNDGGGEQDSGKR